MATSKKSSSRKKTSSGSGPKSKRVVKNKMQKTMHEYKHGELERGRGGKVKNRKQAIAIGLSEARRAGADVPPNPHQKKRASKKTAAKKSGAKKATAKKATAKKSSRRKTASKKRS
jgi:hypothetical protein